MTEERDVYIREFPIHKIPESCTWIVIGNPGSGKSFFIEDLCYANKHKYPVAKVWCGTEDTQGKYVKFVKPLYVTNDYKLDEHERAVIRQKKCKSGSTKNALGIYILDDCNTDRSVFQSALMKGQFKNGAQWWACLFIIASHYIFDMGPDLRKCVNYVAIGMEKSHDERNKLHKNFAVGCTFPEFCQLMDALTNDHTFLIFDKKAASNKMEDCIFYYKARGHGKWSLGCDEYKKWSDTRYNKSYVEKYT